jgi:hypothetical protein
MTVKKYADKRGVSPQAIQKAIHRVTTLPSVLLPGVVDISKQGRFYDLKVRGRVRIGRAKKYLVV